MPRNQINTEIGEIYFLNPDKSVAHPYVLYEVDKVTRIAKLCRITTNMKKISMPWIIALEAGEGNLPKQSIVEVYNQISIPEEELGEKIGKLSQQRVNEIRNTKSLIK